MSFIDTKNRIFSHPIFYFGILLAILFMNDLSVVSQKFSWLTTPLIFCFLLILIFVERGKKRLIIGVSFIVATTLLNLFLGGFGSLSSSSDIPEIETVLGVILLGFVLYESLGFYFVSRIYDEPDKKSSKVTLCILLFLFLLASRYLL